MGHRLHRLTQKKRFTQKKRPPIGGRFYLVAERFTDEDDGVFASGGVAEEMDVVADALWGVAVVADTVSLTGCLDVETGGVDG